jgi:RNA 3'-terminal phosphate cyclase (GTP)
MLAIDGDYLEGGGQVVRTSLALSTILNKEIEVFNIRKRRSNPGLAEQHLRIIEAFKNIFGASCKGNHLGSQEIKFYPRQEVKDKYIKIHPRTSSSVGLILQAVLPPLYFLNKKITLEIKGGTAGKWAPPFDFYPHVVFPLLGIKAKIELRRRGYYPKGAGLVVIKLEEFLPKRIELVHRGELERIRIMSFASDSLKERRVAERQSSHALSVLKDKIKENIAYDQENGYFNAESSGSEINIQAYFSCGASLWSDELGERGKSAEEVGRNAAIKMLSELESGSCCDIHLADNLIPYISILGVKIETSQITQHALTNIWVCENFLGKIFKLNGNCIEKDLC